MEVAGKEEWNEDAGHGGSHDEGVDDGESGTDNGVGAPSMIEFTSPASEIGTRAVGNLFAFLWEGPVSFGDKEWAVRGRLWNRETCWGMLVKDMFDSIQVGSKVNKVSTGEDLKSFTCLVILAKSNAKAFGLLVA